MSSLNSFFILFYKPEGSWTLKYKDENVRYTINDENLQAISSVLEKAFVQLTDTHKKGFQIFSNWKFGKPELQNYAFEKLEKL